MFSSWVKIVVAAAFLLCSTVFTARADVISPGVPLVAVYAEGTRGPSLRAELLQSLPSHMAISTTDLRPGLREAGIRDIRTVMATAATRAAFAETLQAVLADMGLYAVVIARPDHIKQPGAHARLLVVVSGETTARLDEHFDLPSRLTPAQRRARWKTALSAALQPAPEPESPAQPAQSPPTPPPTAPASPVASATPTGPSPTSAPEPATPPRITPSPAPEPAAPNQAASTTTTPTASTNHQPPWLECGADCLWAYRDYAHEEATPQRSTRRYVGSGLAGQAISIDLRPFLGTRSAVLRSIGMSLRGFTMGSFPSTGPGSYPLDDAPLPAPTSWYGGSLGLTWDLAAPPLVFRVGAGYGVSIYDLKASADDRELARGRYEMARLSAELRIPLGGPWGLSMSATYLHVLSIASVVAYMPSTPANGLLPSGLGVEGTLALTLAIAPSLDLRVGGQYDGVFYKATRVRTPTDSPGTIRDQFVWVAMGARLRL